MVECAKIGFYVNIGGIAAGRIELSTWRKHHIARWHGCRHCRAAGNIIFADLDPWAEILGQADFLLRNDVFQHLGRVPMGLQADGGEKIPLNGSEWEAAN
jgi:hypothetical protein